MYEYFGHGFHALSVIRHLKVKSLSDGDLIYVILEVLEVKMFENYYRILYILCYHRSHAVTHCHVKTRKLLDEGNPPAEVVGGEIISNLVLSLL